MKTKGKNYEGRGSNICCESHKKEAFFIPVGHKTKDIHSSRLEFTPLEINNKYLYNETDG